MGPQAGPAKLPKERGLGECEVLCGTPASPSELSHHWGRGHAEWVTLWRGTPTRRGKNTVFTIRP